MSRRTYLLIISISVGLSPLALGQAGDPNQYDYTVPARQQLFTGTLSGLIQAYQTLDNGLDDPNLTGDDRELKFLYALTRTGMLILDTNDVAFSTSLLELAQPYGVTVSGNKFFVPDPEDPNDLEFMPSDPCDPEAFQIHLPTDPNDPNCYLIPPGLDQTILETTASGINSAILPEIDTIISLLDTITDSPTTFTMTLTPAETGLVGNVEVDRGDVLAFKAVLLGVKALGYAAANSAYDVTVDLANSLFNGWTCGVLPESTTANDILTAYPNLLEILPSTGVGRLAQTKNNLIATLDGATAAMDYIVAEADDQLDDLLQIDDTDVAYVTLRTEFNKLRTSVQNGTTATYTLGSEQIFSLRDAGTPIGELGLQYEFWGDEGEGWIRVSNPGPDDPGWWEVGSFYVDDGLIEGDVETWSQDGNMWGWFEGTISSNGSQITITTLQYWGWYAGSWQDGTVTTLSALRTSNHLVTGRFNPNPFFTGEVSPREALPQFDPNGEPIPATFGHGLGDDATLGGVLPDMTQQYWLSWGYEVWAGNTDYRDEPGYWTIFHDIDEHGYVRLGQSNGGPLTVSGNYQFYVIAAKGTTLVDAVRGSDSSYYSGPVFTDDYWEPGNYLGAPDNVYTEVGYSGQFEVFDQSFTGWIVLENPGTWTGLTVLTGGGETTVTASANPSQVVANGTSYSTITITITDEDGSPMQGVDPADIIVSATGTGHTITQPTTATNALGQTTATIVSTEADPAKRINVTLYGQTFTEVATVVFTTGSAERLVFTAQPEGPYVAGAPINAIPQVAVQDATGNRITSSTAQITIAIGTNPGGGTLAGTTTVTASGGEAAFPGLSIDKAGSGYTLIASAAGLTSATSAAFDVVAGTATRLAFKTEPSDSEVGLALSPSPQVGIYDDLGNIVTGASDLVTVQLTGGPGTLTGTTTVSADNGVATFSDLEVSLAGSSYQLTATCVGLTTISSQTFAVTALPYLVIAKEDSTDPVDPNDEVTYTITYGNDGAADATNAVIVEVLPAGLTFASVADGGVYDDATGTITWDVGTIPALTTGEQVQFSATVDSSMADGGVITNSNLTIDCDEKEPVGATSPETTTVNDQQGPGIALLSPNHNAVQVARNSLVRVQVSDGTEVDFDGGPVEVYIEGNLVYDGANETSAGMYDSRSATQAIRGVCKRTGTATSYTFTFVPSVPYGYEKELDVVVTASDAVGNDSEASFHFWTVTRLFGVNAKVNSDTGSLMQDNPATTTDSYGNIWVVWDQTNTAGDTDIYVGTLAADANSFSTSTPIAASAVNERRPAIAVDANDLVYVAWEADDPNGHWDVYVSSSSDGTSWTTPTPVNIGDPNNTSDQTRPSIGVDVLSPYTIYVAYEDDRAGNSDIWVATSTDGSGWSETQITSDPSDQTEPVVGASDPYDQGYVLWTDARNVTDTTGVDIYGAGPSDGWVERAIVSGARDEHSPATVTLSTAHVLWLEDSSGFIDVLYGNDGNDVPMVGTSITDEPNLVVADPAVALYMGSYDTTVFACWEDGRNVVSGNGDTDIYFAESSSPFGTNLLVNDDTGTNTQAKPAIGVDANGDPYMVWVDDRNGDNDIYYAGSTSLEPVSVTVEDVNGVVTVTAAAEPDLQVICPAGALPEGLDGEDITMSELTNIPELPPVGGSGLVYDFGPSGAVFSSPVTIRIPLTDDPGYSVYRIYMYDSALGIWTEDGIHNPATKVTGASGTYLEVQVDHFTSFAAGGSTSSGGGGGGCALAPWSPMGPVEFMLPLVGYVLVLAGVTAIDRWRRRRMRA